MRTLEWATSWDVILIPTPRSFILSINARCSFHFLTSVSGFFATHLWFRDQLKGRGFYTLERYHEDPEKTEEAYLGEYLRTGDVGYQRESGHVFLVNRVDPFPENVFIVYFFIPIGSHKNQMTRSIRAAGRRDYVT